MNPVPLIARILLAIPYVMFGMGHLSNPGMKGYAASMGVPAPDLVVPLTGVLIILGGLSAALGKHARMAGLGLAAFAVVTALWMHRFWGMPAGTEAEQMAKMTQMVMFLKNLGLAGGGLLLFHFGPGPYSLDKKRR